MSDHEKNIPKGVFFMIKKTSVASFSSLFALCALVSCGPTSSDNVASDVKIINPENFSTAPSVVKKHVVSISRMGETIVCTGLVISQNKIVFAHHCTQRFYDGFKDPFLYPGSYVIRGGRNATNDASADFYMLGNTDSTLKIHPSRDLVVMETNYPLPSQYAPVDFFGTSETLAKGASILLAGYGVTRKNTSNTKRVLNFGYMRRATNTTENYKIRLLDETIRGKYYEFDYSNGMLLETTSKKTVSCAGDAGGPAFGWSSRDRKWKAVGLISGGNCTDTTILTDIRDLKTFIGK